ncbi:MAG: Fe-S-containing hydro-lyase [Candidatus Omnitrophica bacterium]|nr:Fe-S-containing hydro-lyase [Candidatus Omnitrophota bacterium]
MQKLKEIELPITKEEIVRLRAGDEVLLSGIVFTARDQAHKRLCECIEANKPLPININNSVIYYCGPTPHKKGKPIGSCGPTTAKRMDEFTPVLLSRGLSAMIGKGSRSKEVISAIKKYKSVYFIAPAGAGAYLAKKVKEAKIAAYPKLGPEAIYRLKVKDFPAIVGIDSKGRNIYEN